MTPLPGPLGSGEIHAWRLDHRIHSATWDSGESAFQAGGRWNTPGTKAVYCVINPSTAILEVAVHKTFRVLDTVPHVLTRLSIKEAKAIHVFGPDDVPNANWLRPGIPSAGQQALGNKLITEHAFVIIPSAVSSKSWNLIFDPSVADGKYEMIKQETFALDTRLHR